jgi:hypothetical protein
MKNIVIIFAIVYLFSLSSFLLPTIVPEEPQTVPFQSREKHPAK